MRRALDRGKFSAEELLESHRRRIEDWQPRINAYSEIFEEPLRQAGASGPLSGIPISIKDSLDIAGHATVCGHAPRRAHRAGQHALCVQRLLNAGATILGKTNTPEMLMNWETHNDVFGATRNPWRVSHTPGGSSGGESAAIAACMSAGGIGSDGGGSIRLPAALTGICGLKPTPGRVPAIGHFPNVGYPGGLLGVIGPMARSVADVRMLFEVVAGHDDGDPFSVPFIPLSVDKKPRVAIVEHPTTRHAAALLGGGEAFPAQAWDRLYDVWRFFFLRLNAHPIGFATPHTAEYLAEPAPSADEVLKMFAARDALRVRFLKALDEYPVLILPNPGFGTWPLNEFPGVASMAPLTVANILGLPALAVPLGLDNTGLPLSVQLVAKPWHEELLLQMGENLEEARGAFPIAI